MALPTIEEPWWSLNALPTIEEPWWSLNSLSRFSCSVCCQDFPWRQKRVDELTEANCVALHEAAALVYFTGKLDVQVLWDVVVGSVHTVDLYGFQ